jgi:hypothetical protein
MSILQQKSSIIHPIFLALFPITFLFSQNVGQIYPIEAIIPGVLITAISIILWYGLGVISKNYFKSGLVVSTGIFLFFFYGHYYEFLVDIFVNTDISLGHKIPLISFAVLFSIIVSFIIITKKKLDNLTKIVNTIVIVIVLFSVFNIASFYISNSSEFTNNELVKTDYFDSNSSYPNIYFIILDGYGHNDYLKKYYNYDNTEFLSELENRGFFLPEKPTSNYPATITSLTSILNMEYSDKLVNENGIPNWLKFYEAAKNNKVMKYVKEQGYEIYNLDSGVYLTRHMPIADHNLCGTNFLVNSEFSTELFRITMLKPVYGQIFETEGRERINCAFTTLNEVHKEATNPFFIFAHIIAPHTPYLFGPNGEHVSPSDLTFGNNKSPKDIEGYIGQLQYVNKKILENVDNILETEKDDTIIVITADHGTRYLLDWECPLCSEEAIRERMAIFSAFYFYDKNYEEIDEDITLVNVFRNIFNTYVDGEFEILENHNYFIRNQTSLVFVDVTDITTSEED